MEYLSDRPGRYGVAVRNIETSQTVLIGAERQFPSASTYKLLVMYRVYQEIANGTLSPEDVVTITSRDAVEDEPSSGLHRGQIVTVAYALQAVITVSSNAAAYALTRAVGGRDTLEAAADELGMSQTGSSGGYFRTTARDMLVFLEGLAEDRLISADASRGMVGLLVRQTVNDRLPALLPDGVAVAHKTGELSYVRNDVGIVYTPGARYVIVVLGQGADQRGIERTIAEVSRRTYYRYGRPDVAWDEAGTVASDGLRRRSSPWGEVIGMLPARVLVRLDDRGQDAEGADWYRVTIGWGAEGRVYGEHLAARSDS